MDVAFGPFGTILGRRAQSNAEGGRENGVGGLVHALLAQALHFFEQLGAGVRQFIALRAAAHARLLAGDVLERAIEGLAAMAQGFELFNAPVRDAALARKVFLMDEEVNRLRDGAYKAVLGEISHRPDNAACLINVYLIARHLERIGDRASNIAEEVIYLVEGEIVRSSEDHR